MRDEWLRTEFLFVFSGPTGRTGTSYARAPIAYARLGPQGRDAGSLFAHQLQLAWMSPIGPSSSWVTVSLIEIGNAPHLLSMGLRCWTAYSSWTPYPISDAYAITDATDKPGHTHQLLAPAGCGWPSGWREHPGHTSRPSGLQVGFLLNLRCSCGWRINSHPALDWAVSTPSTGKSTSSHEDQR